MSMASLDDFFDCLFLPPFRYLVDQGCIGPLCDLLTVMDSKIVLVALNGLENILRLGDQDSKQHGGANAYAVLIEECYGEYTKKMHVFDSFIAMDLQKCARTTIENVGSHFII